MSKNGKRPTAPPPSLRLRAASHRLSLAKHVHGTPWTRGPESKQELDAAQAEFDAAFVEAKARTAEQDANPVD